MSTALELQSGFSRDYVALMGCDAGEGWLPEVESQISSWLRGKNLDIAVERDGDLELGQSLVTVRHHEQTGSHDLRLTIVEQNPGGIFSTELIAHDEHGDGDWISLTVRSDRGRFVEVPKLARYLMDVLPLRDGEISFSARPRLVHVDGVDQLVAVLADQERHSLAFVAGTDADSGIPLGTFNKTVGKWAGRTVGLAQVFVLDPAATELFSERVGPQFGAHPWTLRTYRPGARYDDAADSRRHRFLSTRSLADQSDARISYLLGDIARNHAIARPEPISVQRARRRFERLENRRLVDAVAPESSTSPPPAQPVPAVSTLRERTAHGAEDDRGAPTTELGLVKTILGLKEITEASLREIASRVAHAISSRAQARSLQERLDALQSKIEELEDERDGAITDLKDQQFELEIAELDVEQRDDRIRWLTARLEERHDYEAQHLAVPAEYTTDRPADFDELLQRLVDVPGVTFTGDPDLVVRLGAIDTNGTALRHCWDAVLLMADYVKARDCGDWEQGLEQFVNDTPAGYATFPPGKFAQNETAATMRGWGRERVLSVPPHVDPSGQIEMPAHFKLARIGRKNPRMHIYDAHPHQPLICIGYIGPHLTNTQT